METALSNVTPCDLLRVVHRHQGSPEDLVTVVFDDIGADDWATGGRFFSDADRPSTRCTPHCTECTPPGGHRLTRQTHSPESTGARGPGGHRGQISVIS